MPALVHAADSADETAGRQRAKLDAYTVESDLPFLSSAHMEMRLVLALLCVLIRLQTVMENPGYERKFQAAQVLRDLVDGLIEELSTPVDAVGFKMASCSKFSDLVWYTAAGGVNSKRGGLLWSRGSWNYLQRS